MKSRLGAGQVLVGLSAGLFGLAGCSSSDDTNAQVSVSPDRSNVLTCSTQSFKATVTGASNPSVTWLVAPASGAGAIDGSGSYTAPNQTPSPAAATVTAASVADTNAKASADVTLATAFPGGAKKLLGSLGMNATGGTGIYAHVVATQGSRVYAAFPDDSDTARKLLKVVRSDDGGVTWKTPVDALSVSILEQSSGEGLECPAIAIDAGDPDVVYVIGRVSPENDYSQPLDQDLDGAQTQLFGVSTDGGKTWKTDVLHIGAGGTICADLASPAADTVVVSAPGWDGCTMGADDARDIFVWSDANRGEAFADGTATDSPAEYFANGYVDSLHDLAGDGCTYAHVWPAGDGGTDASGDATESPRLFTDGAGNLCVTYVGNIYPKSGDTITNVYAQCSTDAGQSFSKPQKIDPALPGATSAMGAFGPGGVAALTYSTVDSPDGKLYVAIAADSATFGAPITVPTYVEPDGGNASQALNPVVAYDSAGVLWLTYRTYDSGTLVVDKSCDGGQTWSGAVALTTGTPTRKWTTFSTIDAPAPVVYSWGDDEISGVTLAP